MKKVTFLLVVLAILNSCTKKEDSVPQKFPEINSRIQYPHDYFKEKIDSVDNPKVYSTNILVDLSNKDYITKSIVPYSGYITGIQFKLSSASWDSPSYEEPTMPNLWGDYFFIDPDHADLNRGAGGKYIYFYYRVGSGPGIENFWITTGIENASAACCRDIDVTGPYAPADLNAGAGGQYVWANTGEGASNHQMKGLGVIMGNSSRISAPAGWTKINGDLNAGAGGKFIYFIVRWGS